MTLRISNVRLGLDEPESALAGELARALGVRPDELGPWRILRKSLDARVKHSLHFVYTAEVRPLEEEDRLLRHAARRRHDLRIEQREEPVFVYRRRAASRWNIGPSSSGPDPRDWRPAIF